MMIFSPKFLRTAAMVGCCGVLLAACGKKEEGAAYRGQVVAHVGDQVVTTQELENECRHSNTPADKTSISGVISVISTITAPR